MKSEREIRERIENYKHNRKLAENKKLDQAVNLIKSCIKELEWVLNKNGF